jgi:hypothetical protein
VRERAIDLDLFRVRLAETIAWCSERASGDDPKHSLRTMDLLPPFLRDCTEQWFWEHQGSAEQMQAIVEAVGENRAKHLREQGRCTVAPADGPAAGYLLFCAPDETVWDGVSEPESDGFFDCGDLPPWDTWVSAVPALVRQPQGPPASSCYLLSWVPPGLVELVQYGIEVNPVDCIWWAADRRRWTESDTPFLSELAAAGMQGSVPEVTGKQS